MKTEKKNERGGALLAVLLLIPVMTVGGLVTYKIANNSTDQTMRTTLNLGATYSATNVSELVLANIVNDSAIRNEVVNTAEGQYVNDSTLGYCSTSEANLENGDTDYKTACAGAPEFEYLTDDPSYKNMSTLFLTKRVAPLSDAEPNTIAIEITVRTYNEDNPSWNSPNYVQHSTYQEFNMGLVKVVGCAANYDIYAGNDYKQTQLMDLDYFKNIAYYAGNQWSSCGFAGFASGWTGTSCVDSPDATQGVMESMLLTKEGECSCGILGGACNYCQTSWISGFISTIKEANCGAKDITFANALYGSGGNLVDGYDALDMNDDGIADWKQLTKLNLNGNNGSNDPANNNYYSHESPYPWNSMEKTVINKISKDALSATDHTQALTLMDSDADVSTITTSGGKWYFKDSNHNTLPDIDTPYFYFEGNLGNALPFTIDMMRFRNVYIYVAGSITGFQLMGSGEGMNFGQLYVMARDDVSDFNMMGMDMLNAGMVVMAGNDITNSAVMKGSGISSLTMIANKDIELNSGFEMTMVTRMRLLAGQNVTSNTGMGASLFSFGTGGSCGCDPEDPDDYDESTEFQVGRRFTSS